MKITNYNPVNRGKIKATFSIEVVPGLWIPNFRLMAGSDGDFLGLPARKNLKGEYENLVYLTKEIRQQIEELVKGRV